jgi:hypothetical protein
MVGGLEAAEVKHHTYFELVSFVRRYTYYCAAADLMMVPLTAVTLVNQAIGRQAAATATAGATAAVAPHASPDGGHRHHHGGFVPSGFVPNSENAWPTNASKAAIAKLAAARGVGMPSMLERCVLCRTLRAVKAGEEIMEDYATYECPGPGCSSPIVKAVGKAALSKD